MELSAVSAGALPKLDSTATPRQVATQFEAMLLNQMLNEMQKTVEKSELLDGGAAEDMYREMLNQALSDEIARRGGLGLVEQLERRIRMREDSVQLSDPSDRSDRSDKILL